MLAELLGYLPVTVTPGIKNPFEPVREKTNNLGSDQV